MNKRAGICIGWASVLLLGGCGDPGWADINSRPSRLPECQLAGDPDEPGHEGGSATALQRRCHPEAAPAIQLPIPNKRE